MAQLSMKGNVEEATARCVAAGLAARRADRTATALREEGQQRRLTSEEKQLLAVLEAEATRLSKAFVAAQGALSEAAPALFHQHLAEVNHRIDEQLASPK